MNGEKVEKTHLSFGGVCSEVVEAECDEDLADDGGATGADGGAETQDAHVVDSRGDDRSPLDASLPVGDVDDELRGDVLESLLKHRGVDPLDRIEQVGSPAVSRPERVAQVLDLGDVRLAVSGVHQQLSDTRVVVRKRWWRWGIVDDIHIGMMLVTCSYSSSSSGRHSSG